MGLGGDYGNKAWERILKALNYEGKVGFGRVGKVPANNGRCQKGRL